MRVSVDGGATNGGVYQLTGGLAICDMSHTQMINKPESTAEEMHQRRMFFVYPQRWVKYQKHYGVAKIQEIQAQTSAFQPFQPTTVMIHRLHLYFSEFPSVDS